MEGESNNSTLQRGQPKEVNLFPHRWSFYDFLKNLVKPSVLKRLLWLLFFFRALVLCVGHHPTSCAVSVFHVNRFPAMAFNTFRKRP